MNHRELVGPLAEQAAHRASKPIEPYRAMPLLENSNTLIANELATGAPKFGGDSCLWFFWVISGLLLRNSTSTSPAKAVSRDFGFSADTTRMEGENAHSKARLTRFPVSALDVSREVGTRISWRL
jgi:hypothetical protein